MQQQVVFSSSEDVFKILAESTNFFSNEFCYKVVLKVVLNDFHRNELFPRPKDIISKVT